MTVTVYTFEDRDGNPVTDYYVIETCEADRRNAERHAREQECVLVANTFHWTDSERVADFSPRRRRKQPA